MNFTTETKAAAIIAAVKEEKAAKKTVAELQEIANAQRRADKLASNAAASINASCVFADPIGCGSGCAPCIDCGECFHNVVLLCPTCTKCVCDCSTDRECYCDYIKCNDCDWCICNCSACGKCYKCYH